MSTRRSQKKVDAIEKLVELVVEIIDDVPSGTASPPSRDRSRARQL